MQNKRNGNHKITQITNNNNKGPFCQTKQACVCKGRGNLDQSYVNPGRRAVSFGIIENCHHHHLLRVGEVTRDVYNHKLFKLCHKIPLHHSTKHCKCTQNWVSNKREVVDFSTAATTPDYHNKTQEGEAVNLNEFSTNYPRTFWKSVEHWLIFGVSFFPFAK